MECGQPGCWSTKHCAKERNQAFRRNRQIRRFVAKISEQNSTLESDTELANASEEIIVHVQDVATEIDKKDKDDSSDSPSNSNNPSVFENHILHCPSSVSGCVPRFVSPPFSKVIMFDTGTAHANSGNIAQYIASCSLPASKPTIEANRKALV